MKENIKKPPKTKVVSNGIKLTPSGRYSLDLYVKGKQTRIGTYDTIDEAKEKHAEIRISKPKIETKQYKLYSEVCEKLDYDEKTGLFRWREDITAKHKKGDIAGYSDNSSYIIIQYKRNKFVARKLAWFKVYGQITKYVFSKNGIQSDNRIENLTTDRTIKVPPPKCMTPAERIKEKDCILLPKNQWQVIESFSGIK